METCLDWLTVGKMVRVLRSVHYSALWSSQMDPIVVAVP